MKVLTKRQQIDLIETQLEIERSSFTSHWQELSKFIDPRRAQVSLSDTNNGQRMNQNIIDSTGTMALRTLRSGMMSGVTSPARPWFKLTMQDPEMSEFPAVKRWLDTVTTRMNSAFLRSNLYNVLPIIYGDMGLFGTGAMYIEEDFGGDVFRFQPFQVGSYSIGQNHKLQVDMFHRRFRMTARQLIMKFGLKNPNKPNDIDWTVFSQSVKEAYDKGQMEQWFDVCHMIKPNENYNPNSPWSKDKRYSSDYYEDIKSKGNKASESDRTVFLLEEGYDYFPVLAPRWQINGHDIYGTSCPGMEALGDVKQLQIGEKRSMQAVDKMVNPPLMGPTSLRNQKVSLTPGDITYNDVRDGMQGLRPVHEVNFRITELEQKQAQVRQRIQRAMFEDLFLMLASSDRRQITAREIEERHEEKLLALGPVLEQLNQDLLDPLIDICFNMMEKQGLLPPPPEEIQGTDLKVEYISIMAQAQKMVGLGAIDRFSGFVAQAAQMNPDVLHKINADNLIDVYADYTSIPTRIVRTDDEAKEIRSGIAQQQQQAAQAEQMKMGASAVKDLSQAQITDEENVLSKVLGL